MEHRRIFNLPLYPVLLVFFELCAYLSNDLYLPALPQIEKDYGTTTSLAQLTLTAWYLGAACLYLLLGPLSDRFGRRVVILGGVFLFVISTLLCTFAPTIESLILARLLQGMSICSIGSAGYATVHELYDQRIAIHIIAIMGGVGLMAPALGPLLGAYLLKLVSWRSLFGMLTIWGVLSGILLWRYMVESLPESKRHSLDLKRVTTQCYQILKNPLFMRYTLIFCFPIVSLQAWQTIGPFLVMEQWHYSAEVFGLLQLCVFGAIVLGTYAVKPMMTRLGISHLLNLAMRTTLISGLVALIACLFFEQYLVSLVAPLMLYVFFQALVYSPSQRLAIESDTSPMGLRMSMYSSLFGVFCFLGSFLASATYNDNIMWLAIVMVVAALFGVWVNPKRTVA